MEEAEEAEDRALRRTSTMTIDGGDGGDGEDDQVMTGLMSAATLGGGLVLPEGITEVPDDEELEDSIMTATNTPTPADSIQPN